MNEKLLRELFETFYVIELGFKSESEIKEIAWEFWKKSSQVTETYLKG